MRQKSSISNKCQSEIPSLNIDLPPTIRHIAVSNFIFTYFLSYLCNLDLFNLDKYYILSTTKLLVTLYISNFKFKSTLISEYIQGRIFSQFNSLNFFPCSNTWNAWYAFDLAGLLKPSLLWICHICYIWTLQFIKFLSPYCFELFYKLAVVIVIAPDSCYSKKIIL